MMWHRRRYRSVGDGSTMVLLAALLLLAGCPRRKARPAAADSGSTGAAIEQANGTPSAGGRRGSTDAAASRPAPYRPDIFLITIDACRPDRLSYAGYKGHETPAIDALAHRGASFAEAIAPASWTIPSLASTITSTDVRAHGVVMFNQEIPKHVATLPEVLRRAGYVTGLISGHDNETFEIGGFSRGLDSWNREDKILKASELIPQATAFVDQQLAARPRRPMFLWIHLMDAHSPNLLWGKRRGETEPQAYDRGLRHADAGIGSFVAHLSQLGLASRSLIIFTSDHGQALGEHGVMAAHGAYVYEEMIRVPLVLVAEGQIPKGRRLQLPVSLIDLMPTVLGLLGLPAPDTVQGRNLAPLLRGQTRGPAEDAVLVSQTRSYLKPVVGLRIGHWKLVVNLDDRVEELYDLQADPRELTNLALRRPKKMKQMMDQYRAWQRRVKLANRTEPRPLSTSQRQRLRSLGYIE